MPAEIAKTLSVRESLFLFSIDSGLDRTKAGINDAVVTSVVVKEPTFAAPARSHASNCCRRAQHHQRASASIPPLDRASHRGQLLLGAAAGFRNLPHRLEQIAPGIRDQRRARGIEPSAMANRPCNRRSATGADLIRRRDGNKVMQLSVRTTY
jgi:hypothetical protein